MKALFLIAIPLLLLIPMNVYAQNNNTNSTSMSNLMGSMNITKHSCLSCMIQLQQARDQSQMQLNAGAQYKAFKAGVKNATIKADLINCSMNATHFGLSNATCYKAVH